MSMNNNEIEKSVRRLVAAYVATSNIKPKPSEEAAMENATMLFVNVLQNLNDIADFCKRA